MAKKILNEIEQLSYLKVACASNFTYILKPTISENEVIRLWNATFQFINILKIITMYKFLALAILLTLVAAGGIAFPLFLENSINIDLSGLSVGDVDVKVGDVSLEDLKQSFSSIDSRYFYK